MKDNPLFIEAACRLLEERKDVHFVLAGRGVVWENDVLSSHIPDFQKKYFHLLGERHDIEGIISALDIATSASYSEGFPNTVCEAMACGVPSVVTDVGDSAYIVGNRGLVIPPADPEAMRKAWSTILAMDEGDRQALGSAGRRRIASLFSMERVTREYRRLYHELADV